MPSRTPFKIMNRTVNHLLHGLLRSPLHRLISGKVALLSYGGRRTGRRYTIPVFYRDKGERITVAVGWPDRKVWWRNLTGAGAPVQLVVRGEEVSGHAVATREGDEDAIVRIDLDDDGQTRPGVVR
ncbi:MAG: nitroreductase family deazaflavin-dependent oxidoreductase [Actinobacteria bacterium]|nr:nitroreductase family deazaflavin-dependent oxidoreductase [Actinomycetota bacterium]